MVSASTIAVRSANDIWIACTCDIPQFGPTQAMLHWDGTRWSTIRHPVRDQTYVAKIVPASAKSVWAYRAGISASSAPELMHWNGTSWQSTWIPGSSLTYHYPTLADDGDQGAWVSVNTIGNDASYLHFSAGRWTTESGQGRPNVNAWVYDLARVPGTRSIWSVGLANPLIGPAFIEHRR